MNKILIVIDMQNDFITGTLGTPEAEAIVDRVADKIKQHDYDRIFCTLDSHRNKKTYLQSQEGQKLPVPHCIEGTEGWSLHYEIEEVLPHDTLFILKKDFAMELGNALAIKKLFLEFTNYKPVIEIVGLCTDICVISNAILLKAVGPNAEIIVDSSCCAGSTPELHNKALDVMRSCQVAVI